MASEPLCETSADLAPIAAFEMAGPREDDEEAVEAATWRGEENAPFQCRIVIE